jgi:hypothetical protein
MNHYLDVYDRMTVANFGPVNLGADPTLAQREAAQHQRLVTTKPIGADRAALLDDMNAAHRRVTERFSALDDAAVTRQADVVYSPGTDPYPTSVAAIFDWLIDHYDEHIAQTAQLLARWQAEQAR